MVENVASLYGAAGGNVELALFQDMPHGLAGWSAPEVARMIEAHEELHRAAACDADGMAAGSSR